MEKETFLRVTRRLSRGLLNTIGNIEIIGSIDYPEGAFIVTGNHVGRLEVFLVLMLTDRNDIVLLLADKYKEYAFWRYIARQLDAIWVDREDADFHAMREVLKRLKQGEVLAMAPEGTRSPTEALIEGKPGAAYLAAKSGASILPVGIVGTEDRVVKGNLKQFKKLDITARVGKPYKLPPMDRGDRDGYLQAQTDEIMCQIAALLPPDHRGVYSDHPRLFEILREQGSPFPEDGSYFTGDEPSVEARSLSDPTIAPGD